MAHPYVERRAERQLSRVYMPELFIQDDAVLFNARSTSREHRYSVQLGFRMTGDDAENWRALMKLWKTGRDAVGLAEVGNWDVLRAKYPDLYTDNLPSANRYTGLAGVKEV